jgi:hypothetical protein
LGNHFKKLMLRCWTQKTLWHCEHMYCKQYVCLIYGFHHGSLTWWLTWLSIL